MTRWYELANKLKTDALDTYSVVLAWDKTYTGNDAQPSVTFALGEPLSLGNTSLILSLSAIDIPTKPTGWKETDDAEFEETGTESEETSTEQAEPDNAVEQTSALLDWTVELTDAAGNTATAPLSADSPLYPLINAVPVRSKFLDDTPPTEILFRRFELPLADFIVTSADFNAGQVAQIRFVFDRSSKGAIILDNISVEEGI